MRKQIRTIALVGLTGLPLAGCASLSADLAFQDVAASVEQRTGKRIEWDQGGPDDLAARAAVTQMLKKPLTLTTATQVALLNNRGLQSTYTELGIAQAGLVQAGLLKNPSFDISIINPLQSALPYNLAYGVVFQFIDALYIPLRRRVAASKLEEAKISVSSQVIDHAAMTQSAFVDYLAARQLVGLVKQVEKSARASFEAAKALRKAGNTTVLEFETQQSQLTTAKLDLANAQAMRLETREKVNTALGLSGTQTRWRTASRLPTAKGKRPPKNIEKQAVANSLDLEAARARLVTLAHQYGVKVATSIIPDLEIGFDVERDGPDKEWSRGPVIGIVPPLFDQGRAKRKAAQMEIRRAQDMYWDIAVRVRSAARLAKARLAMTHKQTHYYERAVLPQTAKILNATQVNYNAMQLGVFRLLLAKRDQIQAGQRYIQSLQAYWKARIAYEQLMSGRLPSGGASMGSLNTASAPADSGGH
ncbi:MAG: TolC family protein [Hyphomicrobiaceae bacterium]|nr:TolC family protein [Hyphomicrobiaceae bacterium]